MIVLILTSAAGFVSAENTAGQQNSHEDQPYDLSTAIQVDLSRHQGDYFIETAGAYVFTGSLEGSLNISVSKSDDVLLVMNNAHISNSSGPAIYGLKAQQISLILPEGTRNSVSSIQTDKNNKESANAAIDVQNDLIISGSGSLEVVAETGHGILSQENLRIEGGDINVTSLKDGLRAKDSIDIKDGNIQIRAGVDGIVAAGKKEDKGTIQIDGGNITITAGQDGVQAESSLLINGGNFDIFTGKGGTPVHFIGEEPAAQTIDTIVSEIVQRTILTDEIMDENSSKSMKGLKANKSLTLIGGSFNLNTQDDAIHSKGTVVISGGDYTILTGDDAILAQEHLHIKGGNILITGCYEGFESQTITIDGGNIDITASDDGINAASPEGKGIQYEQDVWIVINGGIINIVAGNDAIDTNGTLTINGGVINLTIKYFGKRNAAIDTDAGYFFNGGDVTTNDGSEKNYITNSK